MCGLAPRHAASSGAAGLGGGGGGGDGDAGCEGDLTRARQGDFTALLLILKVLCRVGGDSDGFVWWLEGWDTV